MENLITLEIEESKREFLLELLENFDFVSIQDNAIWKEVLVNENLMEEMKKEDKKPKRFTDFTLQDVKEIFDLEEKKREAIFDNITVLEPSAWLKEGFSALDQRSFNTEKERSEALIYPILFEIEKRNHFSFKLFSGENVNFNEEKGLKGELDFAYSLKNTSYLEAPIFTVIEAKNDNITRHWGQILAQMIGVKEENAKEENDLKTIFGCISTGESWHFVKLENKFIHIDRRPFSIYTEIEKILGIFQYIVDFYKK